MAITQCSNLTSLTPFCKSELHQKNGIWLPSFEICSIKWRQRKFDSNRVDSKEQTQQANGVGEENLAPQLLSPAHLGPPEL